jgi:hypothetical protein
MNDPDNNFLVKYKMSAILGTFESQSLNSIVAGFSFASAIAWMDVVRWIIANLIKVNKSSGAFTVLAAVLTTLLSIVVYMLLSKVSPKVQQPQSPIYAITR